MTQRPTIGIVEIPDLGLIDSSGKDWLTHNSKGSILISKQVLLSNLRGSGFDAQLIDLGNGDYQEDYGSVSWGDTLFTKIYMGGNIYALNPLEYDAWGVTNNFSQQRDIACLTIKHLASKGRPVVVGGSDAIAAPMEYLSAGAAAIVLDKSGAANAPVMDYVLGRQPREPLSGVMLAEGQQPSPRVKKALHPQDWVLPEVSVAQQCLGTWYKGIKLPEEHWPIGSVFSDIGCDRVCDFCQTPKYLLGYRAMTPERVLEWVAVQKQAGAKAVMLSSDQFLGRIIKKGGRADVLEIMAGIREMGLAVFWNNGIELKKMTLGRGINRESGKDLRPDEELINALFGWDDTNNTGCFYSYLAAERPLTGQDNYKKLLPWKEHCDMIKAIVRGGTANIRYGMIVGFADDNEDNFLRIEEAVSELYEEVMAINPSQNFQVAPFSLSPIPGTPLADDLHESGLLHFRDPSLFGSIWTTSVNTHHLSYKEVFDWQVRLAKIGRSRYMDDGIAIN